MNVRGGWQYGEEGSYTMGRFLRWVLQYECSGHTTYHVKVKSD